MAPGYFELGAAMGRNRATSVETRNRTPSSEARSGPAANLAPSRSGVLSTGSNENRSLNDLESESFFHLPSCVNEELALVQDELDNYAMLQDFSAALKTGVVGGPIGELDVSTANVELLDIALKRHERTCIKTPAAASLVYTAKMVRNLRASLQAGDWDTVENTLDTVAANNAKVIKYAAQLDPDLFNATSAQMIPTSSLGHVDVPAFADDPAVLQVAGFTPAELSIAEISRVEQEAEYRHVMLQMTQALENCGPLVGSHGLDTSSVGVTELARAIDASRALNAKTDKSRHLSTLCRLMWQTRTAVLEDDWVSFQCTQWMRKLCGDICTCPDRMQPSVESLLGASNDVLGKHAPLPSDCVVPASLQHELELYQREANNRKILASISAGLAEGGPTGEIGKLDVSSLDVKKLEHAIKLTLHLGCESVEAKCLLATALHARSMRLALMGGQWERLGELLDYAHNASQLVKAITASKAYSLLTLPNGSTPSSKFSPQVYSNTKDGKGRPAAWPSVVEDGKLIDAQEAGVSGLIAAEMDVMQLELNNRNIVVHLTAAIAKGSCSGTTGHLDLSSVETGQLEWSIDFAQRIGCITEEAKQLLFTAQVVKKIRLALISGDWTRLEQSLLDAQGQVVADIGAVEIVTAQDELNNRAILSELAAALARGRPQGRTGRLYIGSIDVKPLNESISLATKLGPKTVEARQMLFTAKVVARLRLCLLNEDLAEAGMTLEAVRGKMLASVAIPEVRMVQDEVDNWQVISELTAAITAGSPAGSVGSLDLSTVNFQSLEQALDRSESLGVKTAEAKALSETAQLLFRLRKALLADNWEPEDPNSIEGILQSIGAASISDLAKGEVQTIKHESENRRIILLLSRALADGAARGPVGELDLISVQTVDLDG
jgi:hypothetical protein